MANNSRHHNTATNWTDANVDTLKRLWSEGASAVIIAARIEGASKNSVIGKASRLGLERRLPGFNAPKAKPRAPKPLSAGLVRWVRIGPAVPTPQPVRGKPGAWQPLPGTEPKALADLAAHDCRWPIGEDRPYTFCGCPQQAGSSYCAAHAALSAGVGTPSERSALRTVKSMARAA